MKRLFILRHAKSSWAQPGLGDIDRPLNQRGENQLAALEPWLKARGETVELAIVSPAKRTIATWEGIASAFTGTTVQYEDALYNNNVAGYLDTLAGQNADSIMIIGHNPTCDELVHFLAKRSGEAIDKLMARHFGTANLAILGFRETDWHEIGQASGTLELFLQPRDLA